MWPWFLQFMGQLVLRCYHASESNSGTDPACAHPLASVKHKGYRTPQRGFEKCV